MRGASFLVAVTFAAEIGDVRRFDTPPQLMAFLGLVPGERSTGDTVRRANLTLAGNRRARRALVEAAWTYRFPARVSETLRTRLENLPKPVRDIAWKAQVRLCARYRRLSAAGTKPPVVGMTTKVLALTDALGNLVRFVLLPGHRFDTVGVPPLIDGLSFGALIADKAFDSNTLSADLNERGAKIVISQHPRRAKPLPLNGEMYKWRHLIQNFFCKLREFPTVAPPPDAGSGWGGRFYAGATSRPMAQRKAAISRAIAATTSFTEGSVAVAGLFGAKETDKR